MPHPSISVSPFPRFSVSVGRVLTVALSLILLTLSATAATPLFTADFEKAALDKLPDDFMLVDGGFAVKAEGGNQFLELPGAPLDSYGTLFGPTAASNICVTARIYGTSKGRLHPAFGVGLLGIAGYKLQVSPGRGKLELIRGETVLADQPLTWKSATWTHLKLQVRQLPDGGFQVAGKMWAAGAEEPAAWTISTTEKELPPAGRASVWGFPFSGNPIRYDDIQVLPST